MASTGSTSCDVTLSGSTLWFVRFGSVLISLLERLSWPTAKLAEMESDMVLTTTPPLTCVGLTSTPASVAGADVGRIVRSAVERAVVIIHLWKSLSTGWYRRRK